MVEKINKSRRERAKFWGWTKIEVWYGQLMRGLPPNSKVRKSIPSYSLDYLHEVAMKLKKENYEGYCNYLDYVKHSCEYGESRGFSVDAPAEVRAEALLQVIKEMKE